MYSLIKQKHCTYLLVLLVLTSGMILLLLDDWIDFSKENGAQKLVVPTINYVSNGQAVYYSKIVPPGVLARVMGGIGNQLFIYACAYGLAREFNWPLYVHWNNIQEQNKVVNRSFKANHREFALDQFSIQEMKIYSEKTAVSNVKSYGDVNFLERNFSRNLSLIQLNGYCQSIEFWRNYTTEIMESLQPSERIRHKMPERIKSVLREIEASEGVAIHVRRGDYLTSSVHRDLVPISYQRAAIRRIIKILALRNPSKSPVFFVFSDDIQLTKKHFSTTFGKLYRFVYVSELNSTSLQDFYLMVHCKHIIIPNSTFSWWAAYLLRNPNKIVIASTHGPYLLSQINQEIHGKLYHPKSWIVIDVFSGEK